MPEDCGCRKHEPQQDSLTRREFIKTSGVIAASAALATMPLRLKQPPGVPLASIDEETIKLALMIAMADAMYQETDAEIQALGMKLDTSFESVKFAEAQGSLIGLVIPHLLSPSKRMGVDVALTVDVNSGLLTSVHFLIGWSLVALLNVMSVSYDHRDPLFPISEPPLPPQMIRPRVENHWAFPRENSPPSKDIDRVVVGWPPHAEDPAAGYWHFGGCTKAAWLMDREEAVYRCTEDKETNVAFPDLLVNMPLK